MPPGRRIARRTARRTAHRTTRRVLRRVRRRMIRRTVVIGGMMILAASGTAAAIKLSQMDAHRIQEHTGLPPQELEDKDLEQAMQELNIQPQPISSEDQAALAQPNDQTPVQSSPPQTVQPDYLSELEKLGELREKGIITEEEFQAKKKQLLGL